MLRITKQTDLGIVLLNHLASEEVPVSANDLAEATGVPLPTVSKILKILARSALLESQRGVRGGYRLDRAAEDVSVAEIIEALEGPIAFTECVDEGGCDMESWCPMQSNWQKINTAVRRALDGITLAEMGSNAFRPRVTVDLAPRPGRTPQQK